MSVRGEHGFFFGEAGQRRFAVLHRPDVSPAKAMGWVICAPFAEERGFSHRLMVEWARRLAGAGYWTLRFDYRGYGDSDGLFEQLGPDDYREDIVAAMAQLERWSGVGSVGLCGLRLGATLAALTAAETGRADALMLWQPVVRGADYIDELLRFTIAREMASSGKASFTRDDLRQTLDTGGTVVVEGHSLDKALCQAVEGLDLLALDAAPAQKNLIAQVGRSQRPKKEYAALCERWGEGTALEIVAGPQLWTGQDTKEYNERVRPEALFDATMGWLQTHADAAEDAAATALELPPSIDAVANGSENPVTFDVEGVTVRGVLHEPQPANEALPPIVFLPQGYNPRAARHRLYVRLARRLTALGWRVLRFDPRGLGDSDSQQDFATGAELFRAIEKRMQVPDIVLAMDFLTERLGAKAFILTGVCGGGATALFTAEEDRRVVGLVPIDFPLRYTPPPGLASEQAMGVYKKKALSLRSWARLLLFQSDYRLLLRSVRTAVRRWCSFVGHRHGEAWFTSRLGPSTHLGTIEAFRTLLAEGRHVLCINAGEGDAPFYDVVREGLVEGVGEGLLTEHTIDGADHDFSVPEHSAALIQYFEDWVTAPERPWNRPGATS